MGLEDEHTYGLIFLIFLVTSSGVLKQSFFLLSIPLPYLPSPPTLSPSIKVYLKPSLQTRLIDTDVK